MPSDHTISPSDPSEPQFSEDDIDAALDVIRERAHRLDDEIAAALMIEVGEHFHRYLCDEC